MRSRRTRVFGLGLLVVVAGVAALAGAAWASTPAAAHLEQRVRERVRAGGGREVPLSKVAPELAQAVVATEDERFYRHHGIDVIGLLRAIPYDASHVSFAQGASTITEQVAKLLYLGGNDHTPWRKLEDMALAVKLENRYSKQQILAAYLNSAYFGGGAYGAAAASEHYFGVAPAKLTLAQASLLAGLPQAPTAYDPFLHPAAARARQTEVLRSLVRVGDLSASTAQAALARPLSLRGGATLSAIQGVELAPGPAFAWLKFAAGLAVGVAGLALVLVRRLRPVPMTAISVALLAGAALLLVFGAAFVVGSFRTL